LTEIKRLLSTARLITLTGVGGSGKTRLAIRVATELIDSFHDGVWWVDFSSLSNPALVLQSVAKCLGVIESPEQALIESIIAAIQEKEILLVLDNCEHLVEACAQLVSRLLAQCPHLKVLTTSREALRIDGEVVFIVPTLFVPNIDRISIADLLLGYESVKLFVARARAVQNSFVVSDHTAVFVAQICARLDGIPLAIELAAARVRTLSVQQITENLDDAFRLLIGGSRAVLPRQQTLRAMIDWSYDLLRKKEQLLFRRVSVFAGGCTLEAAEQVCAGDEFGAYDVLDLLTNLVSKSLVLVTEQSKQKETRYHMLDTIHKYAHEKLVESGEAESIQTEHLDFFVKFTEETGSKLRGPEQLEALNRLETEYANIRTALEQSNLSGNANAGLQIAWSLMMFWSGRGYWSEARRILIQLLAQPAAIGETSLRVKGLIILSLVTTLLNDTEAAQPTFEESIKIAGDLGLENKYLLAVALGLRGYSLMSSDLSMAQSLCEQALEIGRQIDDKDFVANVLDYLGNIYAAQGNFSMAIAASTESKDGFLAMKNRWLSSRPLGNLGSISFQQGDYDSARSHWEAALAIYQEMGDKANTAFILGELGSIAILHGNYEHSAALYEESLVIRRAMGDEFSISSLLPHLGHILLQEGNKERASALFIEGLILNKKFEHRTDISVCLAGLAALAILDQQHRSAAKLLGLAETVMPDYRKGIYTFIRTGIEELIESVRSVLGEKEYIVAWESGKQTSFEEAVAFALERNS
jgi:predicted ATPase